MKIESDGPDIHECIPLRPIWVGAAQRPPLPRILGLTRYGVTVIVVLSAGLSCTVPLDVLISST